METCCYHRRGQRPEFWDWEATMLYDCFLFWREYDVLGIHLHELAPVVDRSAAAELSTGARTTATYDGDGKRRGCAGSAGFRGFLWDGENIARETDTGGATVTAYSYAPSTYGALLSQRRSGATNFHHGACPERSRGDALGSTTQLTDATQSPTDSYLYRAFGEPTILSGSSPNPFTWVGRLGYYRQPDTSDYWVRARVYGPAVGRWTTGDPLLRDAVRYLYAGNSPIMQVDPSGLAASGGAGWHFDLAPRPNYRTPAALGHGTVAAPWQLRAVWPVLKLQIVKAAASLYGPFTKALVEHWVSNTGDEVLIDMRQVFAHSPHERAQCDTAAREAIPFIEASVASEQPCRIMTKELGAGAQDAFPYKKAPGSDWWGYGTQWDWFNAIGGHVSYGYGWAKRRRNCFTFRFTWVLEDTLTLEGKFSPMAALHQMGLAQDFWVTSRLSKEFSWRKGKGSPGDCS